MTVHQSSVHWSSKSIGASIDIRCIDRMVLYICGFSAAILAQFARALISSGLWMTSLDVCQLGTSAPDRYPYIDWHVHKCIDRMVLACCLTIIGNIRSNVWYLIRYVYKTWAALRTIICACTIQSICGSLRGMTFPSGDKATDLAWVLPRGLVPWFCPFEILDWIIYFTSYFTKKEKSQYFSVIQ